ncbi:MAG: YhdP family protein [Pseudomonadota bacterium]
MERRKRRWWTRGITWLSLIAISAALVSGLFQLAVALAPGYKDEVAARASRVLGQPVQVDSLSLRWRWLWPLLELKGVRLLGAQGQRVDTPVVDVERIRLGFAMGALLRGEWGPTEVEVQGISLAAEITPEGQWRLIGRVQNDKPLVFAEVARAIKRFSRLRVEQLTVAVQDRRDAKASFTAVLQRGDLRLDAQGFELRAEMQAPQVLAARVRLRAGITGDLEQAASWQGRWSLDASDIAPGPAVHRHLPALARVQWTEATLTAAGDWLEGAPGASELSLRAQALALQGEADSTLRDVDLGLHYRPSAEGGTLDFVPLRLTGQKGAWPVTTARLDWRRAAATGSARQWRFNSDFLRLDDLAPWAAVLAVAKGSPDAALLQSLKGDFTALDGRWQQAPAARAEFSLRARFTGLAARWAERGSVQGLSGEITADENSGRAQLQAEPLGFELPKVLATAQRATRFAADAQWQRDGGDWRISLPRLDWALLGSEGQASGELLLPAEAAPLLKLQARFDVADVVSLKPLMPLHWGQSLKDWLDRAVVRGRISKAVLDINGPLADFPYHKRPTGQWSLKLPVSGARLEYHPDWPGVDQLAATLLFAGNGLSFSAQRGVISGVAVPAATGSIGDFASSPLVIDAKSVGEAPYYYSLLRGSPLATRLAALLTRTEAEGTAEADVHLEIPLHSNLDQKTVAEGEVRLLGNNLRHAVLDRPVQNITGKLHFGGAKGLLAEGLQGRFLDTPVTARIHPNAEGHDEIGVALRIDFAKTDGLAARYVPGWLLRQLQGVADWQLAIPLSGPDSGRVRLASSLVGVNTLLPVPLQKTADESWPIRLDLSGDEATPLRLVGELPGRLGVALRFARGSSAQAPELRGVAVRVGPGEAPQWPARNGWALAAAIDTLEPASWLPLVADIRGSAAGSSASSEELLPFLGATLHAQRLRVAGFETGALQVEARRIYGGITATLQGEGTSGQLKLSTAGDALVGQFSTLQLRPAPKAGNSGSELDASEPADPTQAPTLDLTVEKLGIGGRPFGALSFVSERSANGQKLRRAELKGGIAALTAEGEWRRLKGLTEAQSRFTLTSDDLAGTLESLGYAATVSGRNARITGDLTWPAAARGFDWAQARGSVNLAVEEGALRTVEPGSTGRVLGLFNFYALPRRLTLDFGDVVSKGLGFDRIEGQFQLANGIAHTDDLIVRGPSVRIDVRGDVGLAAHDYNQVITVTPNTKGITLGALLLGGAASVAAPVLPLIAVIANQVIDKPLGQVTQLTYGLTGSWDNPEIKKLEPAAAPLPPVEETAKP